MLTRSPTLFEKNVQFATKILMKLFESHASIISYPKLSTILSGMYIYNTKRNFSPQADPPLYINNSHLSGAHPILQSTTKESHQTLQQTQQFTSTHKKPLFWPAYIYIYLSARATAPYTEAAVHAKLNVQCSSIGNRSKNPRPVENRRRRPSERADRQTVYIVCAGDDRNKRERETRR